MGVFKVPMNVVALSAPDNTRLVAIAAGIEEKFNKLFGYFATCHLYFNSSKEVDTDALCKYACLLFLPNLREIY